jgi:hypothetical protein
MSTKNPNVDEAENFGAYILKKKPSEDAINKYIRIVKSRRSDESANPLDKKLLGFARKHRWSIGLIDSYLALFKPESEFRHRLYIMFAILESSHEYSDHFLPVKRGPIHIVYIFYTGAKAVVKIPFGLVISWIARAT